MQEIGVFTRFCTGNLTTLTTLFQIGAPRPAGNLRVFLTDLRMVLWGGCTRLEASTIITPPAKAVGIRVPILSNNGPARSQNRRDEGS